MSEFLFQIPAGTIEPGGALPTNTDPTHGNIGLQGPSLVMLRFMEPTGVRPADSAGNLDGLATVGTVAETVPAWTGVGREFVPANHTYFVIGDRPGRDTLTTRDASLQLILAIHDGMTEPGLIYQRGDDTMDDPTSLALEAIADGGVVTVTLRWQEPDTFDDVAVSASFPHAGDDGFILLTATRRWESSSRTVVRFYVADALVHEEDVDGGIAGATTSQTWIGEHVSGDFSFAGVLDELRLTNYEISQEEIRATWLRLSHWQPAGVEMLRGLIPPGVRWMVNPTSRIGRLMRVVGQAFGYAASKADELRLTWLPDVAYREQVARWEVIRGVAPRPRDSLDTRRARLAALFRREHGYSRPAIRTALADLFDQDADDVSILEISNVDLDTFATQLDPLRYTLEAPADWTYASGLARLQRASAANLVTTPSRALATLSSGAGAVSVSVKLNTVVSFPSDSFTIVGLFVRDAAGREFWVGVRRAGGNYELAMRTSDGSASTALSLAGIYTPAVPIWIRIHQLADDPGRYEFGFKINEGDDYVEAALTTDVADPSWAGFGTISTSGTAGSALDARFDDFLMVTPRGDRSLHWYAYRNPALPGSPDMEGARLTVQKLKPAHTHGAAISRLAVVCDDVDTVCDREPLGGF